MYTIYRISSSSVPAGTINFSAKILRGLFKGGHYFFCLTLFPLKQTTTLLQRSFVGRTFHLFYHFQLESAIQAESEGCPVLPSSVPKNPFSAFDYTFPVVPALALAYTCWHNWTLLLKVVEYGESATNKTSAGTIFLSRNNCAGTIRGNMVYTVMYA